MAVESGNGMMESAHKWYIKEDDNEYASKGVAGTALGIGIGALALTLLGRNGLQNILGNNDTCNNGCNVTCGDRLADMKEYHNEMFGIYKSQIDADFSNYKYARDLSDTILAKHNSDAFSLYQGYTNQGMALQKEIDDIKTRLAVSEATRPYQDKLLYNAIELERERRECSDCSLLNYMNCTFYPVNIADVSTATTSTPKTLGNPLACVQNHCGCGR